MMNKWHSIRVLRQKGWPTASNIVLVTDDDIWIWQRLDHFLVKKSFSEVFSFFESSRDIILFSSTIEP